MPFPLSSTSEVGRPRTCAPIAAMFSSLPKAMWIRCVGACVAVVSTVSCGAFASGAQVDAAPVQRSAQPPVLPERSAPPAFFESLIERARRSAAHPATPARRVELPGELHDMNYDQYRSIRFRPEHSLWRGEPGRFEVQFFHMGFHFQEPVTMHVVQANDVAPFPFSADLFSYDLVPKPSSDVDFGFAGMRVHAPLNDATYRDEVVVFQGASYFRSLGRGEVYGLSARALAIDIGATHPEEFPRFTDFYLVRPGPQDDAMWVLALLESERASGAYAFHIKPGTESTPETLIDVSARIFVREAVSVLGIAPLTSMFLFGEEQPARYGDFRPEVHDSDGLAMWSRSGERLLRSLRNPARTTVCTFRLDSPRGFGLVQRDRAFANYQDLEARYQDRPSAWVEPLGDWGQGAVRLLEFPTDREIHDNIAVAWVPDSVPSDGLDLRYRLHLGSEWAAPASSGWVAAVRGVDTARGRRFLVDFEGGPLALQRRDVKAIISATGGRVVEQHVEQNPFTKGWRTSFEVVADEGKGDVELRAFLRSPSEVMTETWSYLWQPKQ